MKKMTKQKVNSQPRISLNKLAEYLDAAPLRRRTIIKDQKYPSNYITTIYRKAKDVIVKSFLTQDIGLLEEKINEFNVVSMTGDENIKYSLELLNQFVSIRESLAFRGYESINFVRSKPKSIILCNGVKVSVAPDVLIVAKKKGIEYLGAIKIATSKSHPLNKEAGACVAIVLKKYLENDIVNNQEVAPKLCISIDVFADRIVTAPKSYKRRWENIEASCDEIRNAWSSIDKK